MPSDLVAGYIMRALLVLGLACVMGGDVNCASPQLRKEIIDQRIENEEATAIAAEYIPAGSKRDKVVSALAKSSDLLDQADAARTKAEITAQAMSADAARWRLLKWLSITVGVLLVGFAVLKFGRLIPIVGKLLPGG